jgi:predicted transcriptional regulator
MSTPFSDNLSLDTDTEARLQRLAEARRRPANWLAREAIEQYVDREERREKVRKDALAAWTDYQATGLHVTATEVDAWLARLEGGEDVEPPLPHE